MTFWTKDDVELFLTDFWPGYRQMKFPLGQAFSVFLQSDMHYPWAYDHQTKLLSFRSDVACLDYIDTNAQDTK